MALPTNAGTGLVTGRFIVGVADGVDADFDPDGIPAQGRITFVASVPYVPDPTATPEPVTILKVPIVGILDEEGFLCTPDPAAPEYPGARGLRLVATDDEDFSVTGWTWNVSYAFQPVNGTTPRVEAHSMALPQGSTVDLTTVVKVPSSTGIGVEQAEALAAAAAQAAIDSAQAAQDAADALAAGIPGPPGEDGPANVLTVGTVTTSAPGGAAAASITGTAPAQTLSLTLPRGEPGPQGPSGDGGFDADVALSAYTAGLA